MASRPGIVDLRDLGHRYAWDERAIARFLRAAQLTPEGPARISLAPPPVLIVLASIGEPERFLRQRAWLGDAAHVLLVLEAGEAKGAWPTLDFGASVEIFDPSELRVALTRALDLAALHEPRHVTPPWPPVLHAPGPAFELAPLAPSWLQLENLLARQLTRDARLHTATGLISLHEPPALVDVALLDPHDTPLPDGGALQSLGGASWRAGDDHTFEAPGHLVLGFDAHHPLGWTGHRMMVFWLYRGRDGLGFFSASDHDSPCGPAKKLYGYDDNEPRRVQLAADLSAVAYHFDHDVLWSPTLPVAWRRAGDFDVADFPHDGERAVFFVHENGQAFTDDLLDDDARDAAPAFVLAPAGYAVDLGRPVVRVTGAGPGEGVATRLDSFPGYAVFDRSHNEVSRRPGRLLGGAAGLALVSHGGRLSREDLVRGATSALPPFDGEPLYAVPLPGSQNVLLVHAQGDRLFARLL